MEPTAPPPPHTSSAATAAASFASPSTLSSSTSPSAAQSHSQRRSSPYPPSSSSRLRQVTPSSSPAGGSRGPSVTASLYDEISWIRRSSAEYLAQMDAMAEAHRAASRAKQPRPLLHLHGGQQLLHHQARPSSSSAASVLPPLPYPSQQQARLLSTSFTTNAGAGWSPLTPRGGFSGYTPSSSWQQHLEWPSSASATSGLPDLPTDGVSGYTPSFSQLQQALPSFTTAGKPDPPFLPQQQLYGPSSTSVQPSGSSFFANASLSELDQQQQEGSSSTASGVDVFAQSSSTSQQQYELPPLPPSLQWPLLPVKQEPVFHSTDERLEPDLIYIDDEISHGLDDDIMRSYFDESSSHAPGLNDLDMPQSSSSSGDRSSQHLQGVNGAVQPSSWGAAETNIGQSSNTSVPKLRLGGMPLQSPAAGSASSTRPRTNANGKQLFTDAEMETIMKDERLKELVNTDPKRVKTILSNRASAARTYVRRKTRRRHLEHQIEALQIKNVNLSSELRSEQVKIVELKTQNDQMRVRLQQLEMQAKINDAQTKALRAEIESLNLFFSVRK